MMNSPANHFSAFRMIVCLALSLSLPALGANDDTIDKRSQATSAKLASAEAELRLGRDDAALPVFHEAMGTASTPDLKARAMAGFASIHLKQGDATGAKETCAAAWKLAETPDTKVRVLLVEIAVETRDGSLSDKARKKLGLATRLVEQADDPFVKMGVYILQAVFLAKDGKWEEARKRFMLMEAALQESVEQTDDPKMKVDLITARAAFLLAQGKPDKALSQTDAALTFSTDPLKRSQILLLQSAILMEQNRHAASKAKAREALSLAPDPDTRTYARIAIGEADERVGSLLQALQTYEQATREPATDNVRSFSLFKKATVLAKLGRADQAMDEYWRVVDLTEKDSRAARALMNIAILLSRQRKHEEAKAVLKRALEYQIVRPSIRNGIKQMLKELERG